MWSAQKSHGAKIPLQNTYPVNVKAVSCLIKYIINNSCGAGKIPSNNHETTQFILLKSVKICQRYLPSQKFLLSCCFGVFLINWNNDKIILIIIILIITKNQINLLQPLKNYLDT